MGEEKERAKCIWKRESCLLKINCSTFGNLGSFFLSFFLRFVSAAFPLRFRFLWFFGTSITRDFLLWAAGRNIDRCSRTCLSKVK